MVFDVVDVFGLICMLLLIVILVNCLFDVSVLCSLGLEIIKVVIVVVVIGFGINVLVVLLIIVYRFLMLLLVLL